jgi:hypothetical protein
MILHAFPGLDRLKRSILPAFQQKAMTTGFANRHCRHDDILKNSSDE